MASTQLSQTPVTTPVPGAVDATNGNISVNTGATVFRIKNSDTAASHTVTFTSIVTEDSLALADLVVTVAISGDVSLSQLPVDVFGSQVSWLASDGTHLTVSVTEP
jgi:hypothetical protein